jgi:hypothetical protein
MEDESNQENYSKLDFREIRCDVRNRLKWLIMGQQWAL